MEAKQNHERQENVRKDCPRYNTVEVLLEIVHFGVANAKSCKKPESKVYEAGEVESLAACVTIKKRYK